MSSARSSRSAATIWPRTRFRERSGSFLRSTSLVPASWPAVRKVIVTGGSRGLGLAIVRRLICEGYAAIAVARKMNDQLAATLEEVERSEHPSRGALQFIPFDLGDIQDI